MSLAKLAVTLLAAAAVLAVAENKLLWGYWIHRPTLVSEIATLDELLGVSPLPLGATSVINRQQNFRAARLFCEPPSNECLEGRLLMALGSKADQSAEVDPGLLDATLAQHLLREHEKPIVTDTKYQISSRPVSGVGIHFRRGNEEYLLIAYRTSEIANDRYIYSEALYRLGSGQTEMVKQARFFYEVAGIEGLEWPLLWPINFLFLAMASVAFALGRRAWQLAHERRPLTAMD